MKHLGQSRVTSRASDVIDRRRSSFLFTPGYVSGRTSARLSRRGRSQAARTVRSSSAHTLSAQHKVALWWGLRARRTNQQLPLCHLFPLSALGYGRESDHVIKYDWSNAYFSSATLSARVNEVPRTRTHADGDQACRRAVPVCEGVRDAGLTAGQAGLASASRTLRVFMVTKQLSRFASRAQDIALTDPFWLSTDHG